MTSCQDVGTSGNKARYSVVELQEGGSRFAGSMTSNISPSQSPDTPPRDSHDQGKVDEL